MKGTHFDEITLIRYCLLFLAYTVFARLIAAHAGSCQPSQVHNFCYLDVVAVTAGETEATPECQLNRYLQLVNASDPEDLSLAVLATSDRFWLLSKLFSRVL